MIKRIVREIRQRPAYKWHRVSGILAAVFFLILATSGVALNHAETLKLDQKYLDSEWLLGWYGIEPSLESVNFPAADGRWLTGTGASLYLDGKPIAPTNENPVGIAEANGVLVVATRNEIFLFTPEGALIERGSASLAPSPIKRLGVTKSGLVAIEAPGGVFVSDTDLLEWKPSRAAATWSRSAAAPAPIHKMVEKAENGKALSLERVLFDLHSGRLFGGWGHYVMDGVALLLLVLVGTGLYMSFARRRT